MILFGYLNRSNTSLTLVIFLNLFLFITLYYQSYLTLFSLSSLSQIAQYCVSVHASFLILLYFYIVQRSQFSLFLSSNHVISSVISWPICSSVSFSLKVSSGIPASIFTLLYFILFNTHHVFSTSSLSHHIYIILSSISYSTFVPATIIWCLCIISHASILF